MCYTVHNNFYSLKSIIRYRLLSHIQFRTQKSSFSILPVPISFLRKSRHTHTHVHTHTHTHTHTHARTHTHTHTHSYIHTLKIKNTNKLKKTRKTGMVSATSNSFDDFRVIKTQLKNRLNCRF